MSEHPMEGLMKTILDRIQNMINVNTVVGDPVATPGGATIIPISKVCCGFAAGGSEFDFQALDSKGKDVKSEAGQNNQANGQGLPFGGGSGAGVSVKPIGFLVVNKDQVRLLPVEGNMADRIIDEVPNLINNLKETLAQKKGNKPEEQADAGLFDN
ncbi:MAG: GerW family sporulation protein [Peptococcaceae bacterium]|nr:GerW family sporulation protein [Peptococcaceae bacterium]MDR2736033.1 GerW family sporulation protein [Gracilibacteraceae bacterium]